MNHPIIGSLPTHPERNNPTSSYWEELWEVFEARRAGQMASAILAQVPSVWQGYTLEHVAEAVHGEYPGTNQALLITRFIGLGVPMDSNIIPSVNYVDFLRYEILLAEINTWAIGMVGPSNFGIKYTAGRARPEEIVSFLKDALETRADEVAQWDIPTRILAEIEDKNLKSQYNFTAYPEGCPTHPSWPAMHSAASVASFWLAFVMNLTQEQHCEAMALDWGVSYGRTIAGVHFPTDNTAGLNLGQELLARKLPGYLNRRFGSNENAVRAKILQLRFNWEDYLNGPCFN